jgi:hypothetical protein
MHLPKAKTTTHPSSGVQNWMDRFPDIGVQQHVGPNTGVPHYMGMHSHILEQPNSGVPQYLGMHCHILGRPNIWERIPIYWSTPIVGYPHVWECIPTCWSIPACGNPFPYTGVPQYMGMHPHVFGSPRMWDASPHIGVPQ